MIKQSFYKGFSVLLALLVLFSTVYFTIEKHYCGDKLVDVSIFTEAQKCGMESSKMSNHKTIIKACCKDEVQVVQGQDELKLNNFENFSEHQQLFLENFVYVYINLFEEPLNQFIPHKNYSPPNLVFDIHVLGQVFII